jgi:Glutamyl-tRNAGlu reductase, N-terminal domain
MVVGLSHRTASLEVREQLARASETWREASLPAPGVLLATCNRIELYSWVTGEELARLPGSPPPWPSLRDCHSRRSSPVCLAKWVWTPFDISSASSAAWILLFWVMCKFTARCAQRFVSPAATAHFQRR